MKQSKQEVNYHRTHSNLKKCAKCEMFMHPDGCTAVRGDISPQGVCDLFERRRGLSGKSFG